MIFQSLKMKNMWAVGNVAIEFDLNKHPTTLVGGHNGSGKSSILEGLSYSLYGKLLSTNVKLQNAINDINKKNLLVEVTFEKNGVNYLVRRGEKPKIFEIYADDELLNQSASARDYQKMLDAILGMEFKTFSQIVVLNKERYVPFLEMKPAQRRIVIDDLLGTTIYSVIDGYCRNDLSTSKRDYDRCVRDLDVLKAKYDGAVAVRLAIEEQFNSDKSNVESKISSLRAERKSCEVAIETINKEIEDDCTKELASVDSQISEYTKIGYEFETLIKKRNKEIQFYSNNDKCPTCMQDIHEDIKNAKITECETEIHDIDSSVDSMLKSMLSLQNDHDTLVKTLSARRAKLEKVSDIEKDIKNIDKQIATLHNELAGTDSSRLKSAVDAEEKAKDAVNTASIAVSDAEKRLNLLEFVRGATKDDGIRKKVISDYIPVLNSKINEYLAAMGYYLGVTLDEEFNESFGAINKAEFSFGQLSTGQKCRVNLAVWLALLEVASIKNSVTTNFLMLDEILEPMDTEGIQLFMKLCKEKLQNKNIFVITQRFDEFKDIFDSTVKFKLVNDFTVIDNDE